MKRRTSCARERHALCFVRTPRREFSRATSNARSVAVEKRGEIATAPAISASDASSALAGRRACSGGGLHRARGRSARAMARLRFSGAGVSGLQSRRAWPVALYDDCR